MTEMPGGTPYPYDRIPFLGGSCGTTGVASPDDRGGAAVLPGTYSMGGS